MRTRFQLAPVTVATASMGQDVKNVLDVLAFQSLEVVLQVYNIAGNSPSATMKLQTSMQNAENDGPWLDLATFTAVTNSGPGFQKISVTSGLLQYVRWYVTFLNAMPGDTTNFIFEISGIGQAG